MNLRSTALTLLILPVTGTNPKAGTVPLSGRIKKRTFCASMIGVVLTILSSPAYSRLPGEPIYRLFTAEEFNEFAKCPESKSNLDNWSARRGFWLANPPDLSKCEQMQQESRQFFKLGSAKWCARILEITDCRSAVIAAHKKDNKKTDPAEKKEQEQRISEADRLAKELGVSPPNPSKNDTSIDPNKRSAEADALARQLGVSTAPVGSKDYSAAQLQRDIERWEAQEQLRKDEEERQRQIREERERLAAAERAKRAEIAREQQMALRQQQEEEEEERQRQAMLSRDSAKTESGCQSAFGCILSGVGTGIKILGAAALIQQGIAPTASGLSGNSSGGGSDCSREQQEYLSCQNATGAGMCGTYRAIAACASRSAAKSQCAAVAAAARDVQRQAESNARQVCER